MPQAAVSASATVSVSSPSEARSLDSSGSELSRAAFGAMLAVLDRRESLLDMRRVPLLDGIVRLVGKKREHRDGLAAETLGAVCSMTELSMEAVWSPADAAWSRKWRVKGASETDSDSTAVRPTVCARAVERKVADALDVLGTCGASECTEPASLDARCWKRPGEDEPGLKLPHVLTVE